MEALEAAAALGFIGAVGSVGGFLIPRAGSASDRRSFRV
jgi:nitrate/nitrite transporter NarK